MDNLKYTAPIYKFHVSISFTMDDEFMTLVPEHRIYINSLINKNVIESYIVSLENHYCWIVMNAISKTEVQKILSKSPLNSYWSIEVHDVFVYDGHVYRLPVVQLN